MVNLEQIKNLKIEIKSIQVYQKEIIKSNRPEYNNKIRKLFYFLYREGLLKTYKKLFLKKLIPLAVKYF